MGLVFEVLFLFVGINYIIVQLVRDKIADAEYKAGVDEALAMKRADEERKAAKQAAVQAETKKRREHAECAEGVVVSERIYCASEQDMERECIEVFRTLPSWKHITEWTSQRNVETYLNFPRLTNSEKQSLGLKARTKKR